MNRGQKFIKKTFIYTIGSFGSKFLSFIMLPLYTYLISSADYGLYDLITTTITLLIPLVTLQTQEAIITGMISDDVDNTQIIRSTFAILVFNSMITVICIFLLNCFLKIAYIEFITCIIVVKSFFTIIQQYARGLNNSKLYAASGVIYTFIFLSLNIIELVILKTGIKGLFISEIIACILTTVFILIKEKRICESGFLPLNKKTLKWVVFFSLPLVPNAISWWMINASDRYVINFFMGASANGIYAISYKFANILQTITGLVYLAWQEMSIDEYNSSDKDYFLSKSFNIYSKFLLSISVVAFCLSKFVIENTMSLEYQNAWMYTGWLFLGTSYIALSSFLNTGYLVNNKTSEILKGTIIAGIINIVVDVFLINSIGLYAASISTALSALVLVLLRIKDNMKFYNFNFDIKSSSLLSFYAIAIFLVCVLCSSPYTVIICFLISVFVFIYANKDIIKGLFGVIIDKFGGNQNG